MAGSSSPRTHSGSAIRSHLDNAFLDVIDRRLADTDEHLRDTYPGDDGRRQPVHTVYVPADRYRGELPRHWGEQATRLVTDHGGDAAMCRIAGVPEHLVDDVAERVGTKLATDPIEDLRLDFEDGYGDRGDAAEDADTVDAAGHLADAVEAGIAPAFVGLRFKCFEDTTRRRGIRTLDLFLGTLLDRLGVLPDGFTITFPKVSTVSQVESMVEVCGALEERLGLTAGRLRFEIQVETPQIIISSDGSIPIARALQVGAGRVTALHYGTYDYSAALQIAAAHQAGDHPAADFAKQVMQVAVAGTTVHLADGSTNILPLGSDDQVRAAWQLHARLVRRALERGFYQGWDLHAHQLPTRYAATFAFYRADLASTTKRLAAYVNHDDSQILDEPATARALARYLQRGLACGAVADHEVESSTGLTADRIASLARARPIPVDAAPA